MSRKVLLLAALALCAQGKLIDCMARAPARQQRDMCYAQSWSSSGVGAASGTVGDRLTHIVSRGGVVDGWTDLRDSGLHRFPEYLHRVPVTIPAFTVQGRTIEWGCHAQVFDDPQNPGACDALLFVYRCPPCQSKNGDTLAAALLGDDWEVAHCSAYFRFNFDAPGAVDHRLTLFHKEIKADPRGRTGAAVTVTDETEALFWGLTYKENLCQDRETEGACTEARDACKWEAGMCKPLGCPKGSGYLGPSQPQCTVCIDSDPHRP